jgi:Xaa-Pro aminopeptidase
VKGRPERLLELLDEAGVDALLVTGLVNVRYLTGYSGSNGLALIGPQVRAFVTDFRYVEQAAAEVHPSFMRVRAPLELFEALPELLPAGGLRLGFDDADVRVRDHDRLRELLDDSVELAAAGGLVERLRRVKEPGEIELMAIAARVADEALESVLQAGLVGRTEREVAIALEFDMLARGAEAPSFEAIVAAGPHGALPHAKPRDVAIREGQLVVIDWGARVGGYCSDCTRTVAAGEPGSEARRLYELVLAAQLAGMAAVGAGAGGRETDAVARAVIEAAGEGERFGHGLGHGVGLDIHEAPRLSQRSQDTLAAGDAVTVEPGIYLPGEFGIRIEDLVIVTDNGARALTSLPKQLRVCD